MENSGDELPTLTVENAQSGTLTATDIKVREIRVGTLTAGTIEARNPWAL